MTFVLGYPLYQVRKVCECVAFVLGYPLYQVRKVCGLCVRISTIPSEESVCLCVRISTIPSEESV